VPIAIVRTVFLLLAALSIVLFVLYIATGQARYRRWGLLLVKWGVAAGLAFFAVLALERLLPRG
jgi:hypothetical protein